MANAKLFQSKLFDINGGNGGGVTDYTQLENLPKINGVELTGDLTTADLNITAESLGLNGLNYKGETTVLPEGTKNNGDFWVVTENTELADIQFEAGDWLIWNNGKWDKIENFDAVSTEDIAKINAQIDDIYSQFSLKQNVITGSEGDVAYYNGKEIETKPILREDYICVNDEEVELCKGSFVPSFVDTFSHLRGVCNHSEEDKDSWEYDVETKRVIKTNSNTEYSGVITLDSYSNYDFTVKVHTQSKPTGHIGILTSFAKDSDGYEHTLSFLRKNGEFICKIDHCSKQLHANKYGQIQLGNTQTFNESLNDGENTVIIQVIRHGNVIIGKCSAFNDDAIIESKSIEIDLDELSQNHKVLNLFKGSSPIGYATLSQGNVSFENISFDEPNGRIYKLPYTVYEYDYDKSEWVENSELKPLSEIGIGRFAYNSKTQKLFYTTRSKVIQVADISHNQLPPFTSEDDLKVLTIDNGQTVWSQLENNKHLKGGWKECNLKDIKEFDTKCLKNGSAVYNIYDSTLYIYNNGEFKQFGVNSVVEEISQLKEAVAELRVNVKDLNERVSTVENEIDVVKDDIEDLYSAQVLEIKFEKTINENDEIIGFTNTIKVISGNSSGIIEYDTDGVVWLTIQTIRETYPSVMIIDMDNNEYIGGVHYDDKHTIKIKFIKDITLFEGHVYLN